MIHINNLLRLVVVLLPCIYLDLCIRTLWLSTLYQNRGTQIFLFARSTTSSTRWASFSCSSLSLGTVGIITRDRISSPAKFSAAMTSWFLNRLNWLNSASLSVRFYTSRKTLLSCGLENLSFSSKFLKSHLDSEYCPNLNWHLPNFT